MEFFKANTTIDFMGLRKISAGLSIVLFIFSLVMLATHGLNWGLDFTGGTQVQVAYPKNSRFKFNSFTIKFKSAIFG